jgi:hypothetical protein
MQGFIPGTGIGFGPDSPTSQAASTESPVKSLAHHFEMMQAWPASF